MENQNEKPKLMLDTREAARMLGVCEGYLENKRYKKPYDGPPYAKMGAKVVYPVKDLEEYIEARMVRG